MDISKYSPVNLNLTEEGEKIAIVHGKGRNQRLAYDEQGDTFDFHGNHPRVHVHIYETNRKLTNRIVKGGMAEIGMNGVTVYGFTFNNTDAGILKLAKVIHRLRNFEHCCLWDPDDIVRHLIGRRIYFRENPCFIEMYQPEVGQLTVAIDQAYSHYFSPEAQEIEYPDRFERRARVEADLLDTRIHWFRGERQ